MSRDERYGEMNAPCSCPMKALDQACSTADSLTSTPTYFCLEDGGHGTFTQTKVLRLGVDGGGYLKYSLSTEASQEVLDSLDTHTVR